MVNGNELSLTEDLDSLMAQIVFGRYAPKIRDGESACSLVKPDHLDLHEFTRSLNDELVASIAKLRVILGLIVWHAVYEWFLLHAHLQVRKAQSNGCEEG